MKAWVVLECYMHEGCDVHSVCASKSTAHRLEQQLEEKGGDAFYIVEEHLLITEEAQDMAEEGV